MTVLSRTFALASLAGLCIQCREARHVMRVELCSATALSTLLWLRAKVFLCHFVSLLFFLLRRTSHLSSSGLDSDSIQQLRILSGVAKGCSGLTLTSDTRSVVVSSAALARRLSLRIRHSS
jgi:hypothetical protein